MGLIVDGDQLYEWEALLRAINRGKESPVIAGARPGTRLHINYVTPPKRLINFEYEAQPKKVSATPPPSPPPTTSWWRWAVDTVCSEWVL